MEVLLDELEEESKHAKKPAVSSMPPPPPGAPIPPAPTKSAPPPPPPGGKKKSLPPPPPAPRAAPPTGVQPPRAAPPTGRAAPPPAPSLPKAPAPPPDQVRAPEPEMHDILVDDDIAVDEISIDTIDSGTEEIDVTSAEVRLSWSPDVMESAEQLVEELDQELKLRPSDRRAARLHFELARLFEAPLGDLRRAASHYQEALKRQPESLPALRGARRVLIARRSYQAALKLFDEEVRITPDPPGKARLLHAKGRLLEDVLARKDAAGEAYAAALELDRANPAILRSLIVRYGEEQKWDKMDRVLEQAANAVADDPRHRAALVAERARLAETKARKPERATELYEIALRLDPRAPGALAALKRLHHSQRRWRDLIRVLQLEADLTQDPQVKRMALYRISRLHSQRLGNRNEAVSALEGAAEETEGDLLILAELSQLYDQAARWDALAETLAELAQFVKDPDERLGILHRIGAIYDQRLNRPDSAIRWYEASLTVDSTHIPTLQALAPLYSQAGEWEALIRMHLGEAEHASDAKRRASAHVRVAEVLEERLNRIDDAIEHHAKALSIEPGYPAAFKALARLLPQTNRYRELAELFERSVDLAPNNDTAIASLLRVGAVYEDQLSDPGQAAQAYRRILELDPKHLQAIQSLQRATERAGRYRDLVQALQLEADLTQDEDRLVGLLHRAGEVLDDQLSDRDGALEFYRRVVDMRPDYLPALASLGRLYHALGRWEDLLGLYEKEVTLAKSGRESVTLLQKMAELCQERIGREDAALGYYRQILDIEPTHGPALRALTRRLRARNDWAALVEVLTTQFHGYRDPSSRAQTAYQIGLVWEEQLADPAKALKQYEKALVEVPAHRPSLDAVSRLRASATAWAPLADDLAREAEATGDRVLATDALMRRAELYATELNEPRRAIACCEQVLDRDPTHLGALLALEALYRRVGTWDLLASVHAAQAKVFVDAPARVAALEAQAQVMEARSLGGPGERASIYQAILEIDPTHEGALRGLEHLALSAGDPEQLAAVDQRLAHVAEDPAVRAAHLIRMAESLESMDREGALDAFRQALRYDPESIAATRGLSRIAERIDDPSVIAEAARREAEIAQVPAIEARMLVKSAQVRIERLGDVEGALSDLQRALELDPDSEGAAHWLTRVLRKQEQYARLADLLGRAAAVAPTPHRSNALWLEVANLQAEDLGSLTQAIASLGRVMRASPNHVPTLRKLADYYKRDSQWSEAVKMLTRVIQLAPDHDILKEAHRALADIWIDRLADPARALVSLQAVLQLDPSDPHALSRLVELHERDGRVDEAAEAAQRLLASTRGSGGRAEALVQLARLERNRGNDAAAAEALRDAVALEGPGSESALECKALCRTTASWNQYVGALEKFLASVEPEAAGPTYLEMGRVLYDQLERPNEAVELLEKGAGTTQDPHLRRELAMRLRLVGRSADAIEVLQGLAKEDLTRTDVWRELVRTYDEAGRAIEARVATGPLFVLGTTTERDQRIRQESPPRPAAARPGTLANILDRLGSPSADQAAAGALLRTIESALVKLYPPELESYGLSSRDKLTTRAGHPLRSLGDELGAILGVPAFDLYVHRTRTRGMGLELGSTPMIIVPAAVAELPRTQQVFLLARPLVHIARGYPAVGKLTPRELEVLLASAARNVRERYGTGLTSEEILNAQAKRIYKALSRRNRKAMEEAANAYVDVGRVDFPRWERAARRTAIRVAGLLADDLKDCVDVLRRTERDTQSMTGSALIEHNEVIADLVAFWASKAAMHIRKHAGLLG